MSGPARAPDPMAPVARSGGSDGAIDPLETLGLPTLLATEWGHSGITRAATCRPCRLRYSAAQVWELTSITA